MATPSMGGNLLQALSDLLNPESKEDEDGEVGKPTNKWLHGANRMNWSPTVKKSQEREGETQSKDIWSNGEVTADAYDYDDTRQQPE